MPLSHQPFGLCSSPLSLSATRAMSGDGAGFVQCVFGESSGQSSLCTLLLRPNEGLNGNSNGKIDILGGAVL